MIAPHITPPRPSWNNPDPTNWATGFSYVSHVPPAAIGPQIAGQAEGDKPKFPALILVAGIVLGLAGGLFLGYRVKR